jgi:hypothetical protein
MTYDAASSLSVANDITGALNVLSTNETTLLIDAEVRLDGVRPWTVMVFGAAIGHFALYAFRKERPCEYL